MVDSLDTMYMMGLSAEFERGIKLVRQLEFVKENVRLPFILRNAAA